MEHAISAAVPSLGPLNPAVLAADDAGVGAGQSAERAHGLDDQEDQRPEPRHHGDEPDDDRDDQQITRERPTTDEVNHHGGDEYHQPRDEAPVGDISCSHGLTGIHGRCLRGTSRDQAGNCFGRGDCDMNGLEKQLLAG